MIKEIILSVGIIAFLIIVISGCCNFYSGRGCVVHDDVEANNFGWAWFDSGNYKEAEKMALVAIEINSECHDAYNLLGFIEMRRGNYEKASEFLEQALNVALKNNTGDMTLLLNNIGYSYFASKQYNKALDSFVKSYNTKQDWVSAFGKAISAHKLHKTEIAQSSLDCCKKDEKFISESKKMLSYFNVTLDGDTLNFVGL